MYSANYRHGTFMGFGKVSNEEGRVVIPSSIDDRPMEEVGMNAYAQMDRRFTVERIRSLYSSMPLDVCMQSVNFVFGVYNVHYSSTRLASYGRSLPCSVLYCIKMWSA